MLDSTVTNIVTLPIMSMLAEPIIDAFGGLSKTAKALGHKNVTTVQGWLTSGSIPHWRRHEILEAAKRLKLDLPENAFRKAS